ncbi:unnamed protein product [Protopolystoma xenopodis]|uniref:Uncharacterized protein n=1 Tax=Protopolystoma xenopodis TaxID=117903 RepID=A0A448X1Y5_9PLAT|nr:unnamed protein product [Protopolystoma xenopodis]
MCFQQSHPIHTRTWGDCEWGSSVHSTFFAIHPPQSTEQGYIAILAINRHESRVGTCSSDDDPFRLTPVQKGQHGLC